MKDQLYSDLIKSPLKHVTFMKRYTLAHNLPMLNSAIQLLRIHLTNTATFHKTEIYLARILKTLLKSLVFQMGEFYQLLIICQLNL